MIGVKCTGKRRKKRRGRWKRRILIFSMSLLLVCMCAAAAGIWYVRIDSEPEYLAAEYEMTAYKGALYQEDALYADQLCVVSGDILAESGPDGTGLYAAGLFNVNERNADMAYHVHERLYPASTTKIMTALVAIKNGELSDLVTVSANAAAASFASDEVTCGIREGDQITLEDLLYGLLLYSGNDNAVAIAEHIAGSTEAFAEMMNAQAAELMATNSHFVNPNGLHDEEHYTTAYDLYLIFNECVKYPEFITIIQTDSYTAHITGADGTVREMPLLPTNYYMRGLAEAPADVTIIGGKTGTTDQAGNCLILLEQDLNQNPYISVVMGAESKTALYENMTALIEVIPNDET